MLLLLFFVNFIFHVLPSGDRAFVVLRVHKADTHSPALRG